MGGSASPRLCVGHEERNGDICVVIPFELPCRLARQVACIHDARHRSSMWMTDIGASIVEYNPAQDVGAPGTATQLGSLPAEVRPEEGQRARKIALGIGAGERVAAAWVQVQRDLLAGRA